MATPLTKTLKITSLVTRILGCNPGMLTLQGTNTYLVGSGQKRILIDTGEKDKKEYLTLLTSVLEKEKAVVEHIIITHWHLDHIGGLEDVLKTVSYKPMVWKYPRTDGKDQTSAGDTVIQYLIDGQEIKTDGATLKVIHTPGHTTDHISLKLEEENSMFSGDCILGEGTAVFQELYDYMKSLEIILALNPEKIYPGHGPVIDDPKTKVESYVSHRNKREAEILDAIKSKCGITSKEIVKIIYADVPEQLHIAAEQNVLQHLLKLSRENKVKFLKENEKWTI